MIKVTNVTTKKYELKGANQDVAVVHIEHGEDKMPDTIVVDYVGLLLIQKSIEEYLKENPGKKDM